MQKNFDLDLGSLWYTKMPPAFPVPSMRAKGPSTSSYSYCWEQDFGGTRKTLVTVIRWTHDLSMTKVQIKWKESDPRGTVVAEQKHFPPPTALSPEQLDAAHKQYGPNIATWSESSVGTTVGDGECWTFIDHALKDLASTYRSHGKEGPMLSQSRSHGACILSIEASAPGSRSGMLQLADVRRGDILQMKSAHFKIVEEVAATRQKWGKWTKRSGEKNVRLANHTAVVTGLRGDVLEVVEQNAEVAHGVSEGKYDLAEMQEGTLRIFRVIGERWCPPLEASWD